MKGVLVVFLAIYLRSAFAGYGNMGSYEAGIDSGSGGDLTLGSLFFVFLYFAGIVWFMTRFKDESEGFLWLMGAVFALIVAGWIFG